MLRLLCLKVTNNWLCEIRQITLNLIFVLKFRQKFKVINNWFKISNFKVSYLGKTF